mmetsp:Transcript_573/g.728  ORF Transcript_573/g.728 Transcript_573/m.728 type:complete len:125 (-) Transcript_573:130-504(-)
MEIHELQRKIEQNRSKTSEFVFNSRNTENSVNVMIDLHGLTKVEALRVTRTRLQMTQDGLIAGSINPNAGDNKNHIFKIVAGAGNHSGVRGAVLKPAVEKMLIENNYEHYANMQHGVFLVRLRK